MLSERPLINVRVSHRGNAILLTMALVLLVPGLVLWPYRTFVGGVAYGTAVGSTATILTVYVARMLARRA